MPQNMSLRPEKNNKIKKPLLYRPIIYIYKKRRKKAIITDPLFIYKKKKKKKNHYYTDPLFFQRVTGNIPKNI